MSIRNLNYDLSYKSCISCINQHRCPIVVSGAKGTIRVPKPHLCLIDQLQPTDLEALARQLENHLGYIEVQKEILKQQLDFVLQKIDQLTKTVICR